MINSYTVASGVVAARMLAVGRGNTSVQSREIALDEHALLTFEIQQAPQALSESLRLNIERLHRQRVLGRCAKEKQRRAKKEIRTKIIKQ